MKGRIICGLVIGEAGSEEKAQKMAQEFKGCPYTAFIGAFADKLVWACFVPESHLWWLESMRDEPVEAWELKSATLLMTDEVKVTYPKEFEFRLPQERLKVAPCGAVCKRCPQFDRCSGCPATIYYKGGSYAG